MDARATYPEYYFPRSMFWDILISFIEGSPRNIHRDALLAIAGINPPIHTIGSNNIPKTGPVLITMNHYARQDFSIVWAGIAIAAHLPENQFWLMTSAWTNRGPGFDRICTSITRLVFRRLADMYGAITTPPLPAIPEEQNERTVIIRKLFRLLKNDLQAVLCVAPEGRDSFAGGLGMPAEGAGKLLLHLDKQLSKIVLVGVWERFGRLILNFGEPDTLKNRNFSKNIDNEVSMLVMNKIASLLPSDIRRNIPLEEKDEKE